MPLDITRGAPTLLILKSAFERAGLQRSEMDRTLGLTEDEFRVEGAVVAVGPLYEEDALGSLVEQLEGAGLVYYDDFFELSGNWPEWLAIYASIARAR
jgi:hypothetical protein